MHSWTEGSSGLRVALVACVTSMCVAGAVPEAHAATSKTDTLYKQGKAALNAGDHAKALARFKAALQSAGSDEGTAWQMMLAIAVTYRSMEEMGHAIEYYKRFLTGTEGFLDALDTKWLNRRALVEADIPNLEAQAAQSHAIVLIKSVPEGARLFIDDRRAGADGDAVAPLRAYLKPGVHRVRAELEGYVTGEAKVTAVAGKLLPLTLKLEAVPEAAPAVAPEPVTAAPAGESTLDAAVARASAPEEGDGSLGPWLLIGGASAAVVGGVVLNVLAAGKNSDLGRLDDTSPDWTAEQYEKAGAKWRSVEEERDLLRILSGVLYGVAGAALAGGIVWILLDGEGDGAESAAGVAPAIQLAPISGGAYGHATWRF